MSAKEMFEKLGYKQYKHEDSITYNHTCKTYDDFEVSEHRYEDCIRFIENDEIGRFITTGREEFVDDYYEVFTLIPIDMKLLKAINKQVEELGWNK